MEGWNDPMDLSKYEPSGKLKINLNKRVAYPLNKSQNPAQSSSGQIPLTSLPTIPISSPPNVKESDAKADSDEAFDPQSARQKVFSTLEESIKELEPNIQANVKSKLKALENEWDGCDLELQKLLVQLTEFIEQKDAKSAGGVQRKMIMKGYNKPWIQGIRQVIFSLEAKTAADDNAGT